jgi:hypothetical protein
MKREIYVSVDIEADGPIPGHNSMLSFGAAAFDLTTTDPRKPVSTFEVNLRRGEGTFEDPDTMAWWRNQPEAWAYLMKDRQDPFVAMPRFLDWTFKLSASPVMVCYPVYDFMFLHWYIMRYGGVAKSPYSFAALDVKTLAMVALGRFSGDAFKGTSKRTMDEVRPQWFEGQPKHDHTGLADAIGQGILFVNIMEELKGKA